MRKTGYTYISFLFFRGVAFWYLYPFFGGGEHFGINVYLFYKMLHSGQVRHDLVRLIRKYYLGFPPKFPQICLKNNLQPLKIELPKSPLLETEQKSCVDLTPLLFSFIPNPSSTPLIFKLVPRVLSLFPSRMDPGCS